MLSNPAGNLQNLITSLLIDSRYKEALREGLQKYQIKQFRIERLAPHEVFAMHYVLSTKFYYKSSEGNEPWCENELRLYIWVLVCYSYLHKRCISEMGQEDWLFFSEIFNCRSPDIFEFQALSILKKEVKFCKWTEEEVKLLDSIIKSRNVKNKWNDIAKNLFVLSEKRFFRTSKQCREYWINHLDPVPRKSDWELHEDLELVKAIRYLGKKWSKVSKKLHGRRTQHMVKNRYKSLYQFEQKRFLVEFRKTLSEEEMLLEIEKRLKLAIETEKAKPSNPREQPSKNQSSQWPKFSSADDSKVSIENDAIEELLLQSANEDAILPMGLSKLAPQEKTIFSFDEDLQSEYEHSLGQPLPNLLGSQNYTQYFSQEFCFNL